MPYPEEELWNLKSAHFQVTTSKSQIIGINAWNKYEIPLCIIMCVHYKILERTSYMKQVVIKFKRNNY